MQRKAKPFNYKSLIRSAARRIWMWSPMRREAIRNARVAKTFVGCAECKKWMKENPKDKDKEYQVDHTIPASEPAALIHSWDDFFDRLFKPSSELKVLCKVCHAKKTEIENASRNRSKRKSKRRRSRH